MFNSSYSALPHAYWRRCRLLLSLLPLLLTACASAPPAVAPAAAQAGPPIRFLLTFDDGPSAREGWNPTSSILDDLAANPIQPGIKALFFVQTRAVNGGGTELGRRILRREQADGHLLGFHTATPRHSNHRTMEPQQFESSLQDGIADLHAITGVAPKLVRPPFWNYDARTFAIYQQHGLQGLLTTLSANDGKIYGFHASPTRRRNLLTQLAMQASAIRAGTLPQVDGVTPIVVTFHDVNDYTARHMREYLQILLDVAQELELPVADKPFYDEREALERAALASTVTDGSAKPRLPGFWNWWWN